MEDIIMSSRTKRPTWQRCAYWLVLWPLSRDVATIETAAPFQSQLPRHSIQRDKDAVAYHYKKKNFNTKQMDSSKGLTGVMIIPTGIGCKLGGHAAFNPGVKLIASCAKQLIVNPNALNASDINEQPPNVLYVEGSSIDRFLDGEINLHPTKTYNRILMVVNDADYASHNTKNAGIWGLGADIQLLQLTTPLRMMVVFNEDGTAGGSYSGVLELIEQVRTLEFDALAISTAIETDTDTAARYWQQGGVNPWGGIEAVVSKLIATALNKPVAHAPVDSELGSLHRSLVVDRDMSPEVISNTYMFCVLKGLHRAPRIMQIHNSTARTALVNEDIDFLISPHGCWGPAHAACTRLNIPVIVVRENTTCLSTPDYSYPSTVILVQTYLEAAGLIQCLGNGIDYRTVLARD
jgi:hypothetical protein